MSAAAAAPALAPVPAIVAQQPYVPAAGSALIDLPLGGTERPLGAAPSPSWAAAPPLDADSTARYPDARALEATFAARLGLPAAAVLVTAGADEAIDRTCRAMLCPGRSLLVAEPTFEMIPLFARLAGADVVGVPWDAGADYPLEAVLGARRPDTAVVAVVSPNNPTGGTIEAAQLARLARALPHALVLLDAAYGEFAAADLGAAAAAHPNVVVVRTLSKAWGLPGLRVGYASGSPEVIGWLRRAGGPFSVARTSLAVAHARLQDGEAEMRAYVQRVQRERRQLRAHLGRLGAQVPPSQANFVLPHFADAPWATAALGALGIGVRAPRGAGLAAARRITCPGDDAAFERLRRALVAALRPQALLFDVDGVLVDVGASYRAASIATAAHFGAEVSAADLAAAKAQGHANNDWQLTHRLLAERGVQVPLEAVVAVFEAIYQGTDEAPGLWARERLLCAVPWLQRLATRLPLALVTGRPRRDLTRFCTHFGLQGCFRATVCMEEAALKPDPAPVRLALARLGVQAAWMVGDTPDDVRAARGAGVVPLAVVAPGDDPERAHEVFARAGAARVLAALTDLDRMLP